MFKADELRQKVEDIPFWYHTMDLGQGVTTKGISDPKKIIHRLALPESLSGKTVLDVGAWDGYYSFEAKRRGAKRVLATDWFCWGGQGFSKAGFDLARQALGLDVDDLVIDVTDLSPDRVGTFDIVLFLGVLYHVKHPIQYLEKVYSVTGDFLVLETAVDLLWMTRPAMVFYPDQELNDDSTNWWGPNIACVKSMLLTVGYKRVEVVYKPVHWLSRLRWLVSHHRRIWPGLQQDRAVFHAWK